MSSRISPGRRILFATLYTALFILFLEIVLWAAGVRVFDPFDCRRIGDVSRECVYNFNSRIPPVTAPPADGVTRVIFLGESAVNGWPFEGAGFPEMLSSSVATDQVEFVSLALNGVNAGVLREILKEAIEVLEPDVVIVYAGNNEVLGIEPVNSLEQPRLSALVWWMRRHSRIWNLPKNVLGYALSRGLAVDLMARIARMDGKYDSWLHPPQERKRLEELYIHRLAQMIRLCRRNGVDIVLCTPGSNLASWMPMKSAHSEKLPPFMRSAVDKKTQEAKDLIFSGRPAAAVPLLAEAVRKDPEYARAWFLLGRALLVTGRTGQAVDCLEKAADNADFFQQVPPSWNRRVRKLAKREKAGLFDTEAYLREVSDAGLPGFDLFVDGCHPTLNGHRELALFIGSELKRTGLPVKAQQPPALAELIKKTGANRTKLGIQYLNQSLVLAFLFSGRGYEPAAIGFLDRSIELGVSPAVASAYQGYLAALLDDPEAAARYFTRARKADPVTFGAAVKTMLSPAVEREGEGLCLKALDPEDLVVLYPGSRKKRGFPRPEGCARRFPWKDGSYTPLTSEEAQP